MVRYWLREYQQNKIHLAIFQLNDKTSIEAVRSNVLIKGQVVNLAHGFKGGLFQPQIECSIVPAGIGMDGKGKAPIKQASDENALIGESPTFMPGIQNNVNAEGSA
jgi:hypothetical protein